MEISHANYSSYKTIFNSKYQPNKIKSSNQDIFTQTNSDLKSNMTVKSKKNNATLFSLFSAAITALFGLGGCSSDNNINPETFVSERPEVKIEEFDSDYLSRYLNFREENPEILLATKEADSYIKDVDSRQLKYAQKSTKLIGDAIFSQQKNVINGYLDETITQGLISDCWLITAAKNLSYTPSGAKIIHDAITQKENGDIDVYFKGPNLTYTVTLDELSRQNGQYTNYSKGDDDMLAIELAANKFRQDLIDGNIELDENLPYYCFDIGDEMGTTNLTSGETRQAYWLLAGITNGQELTNSKEINTALQKYAADKEHLLLDVVLDDTTTVDDVNGNKQVIYAYHGYGIKDIKDDVATLISSSYTHKDIDIPLSTLKNLPLSCIVCAEIE